MPLPCQYLQLKRSSSKRFFGMSFRMCSSTFLIMVPHYSILLLVLSLLVDPLDSTCTYSANRNKNRKIVKVGAVFTEDDVRRGVTKAFEVRTVPKLCTFFMLLNKELKVTASPRNSPPKRATETSQSSLHYTMKLFFHRYTNYSYIGIT